MEPVVAIAASVRGWPEALRRFLADHGGARVRVVAMSPDDLADETFDVLVVDDLCSFLTPRLVRDVVDGGRRVVGLFDGSEAPEGRRVLERCGIETIVGVDAGPPAMVAAIGAAPSAPARDRRRSAGTPRGTIVAVAGPRGGCGRSEVALTIAARLARREGPAVLVDLDGTHPSLAVRLGLGLHPDLTTALDLHRHGDADPAEALQWSRRLGVLVGVRIAERRSTWRHDVAGLLERLAGSVPWVVVDAGEGGLGPVEIVLRPSDLSAAVVSPDPVGIARLVEWYAALPEPRPVPEVLVNRAPADPSLRAEIAAEITRSIPVAGFGFLPGDATVPAAVWDGLPVRRGPFHRALVRWMARSIGRRAT